MGESGCSGYSLLCLLWKRSDTEIRCDLFRCRHALEEFREVQLFVGLQMSGQVIDAPDGTEIPKLVSLWCLKLVSSKDRRRNNMLIKFRSRV
jgi:hypothetical protein